MARLLAAVLLLLTFVVPLAAQERSGSSPGEPSPDPASVEEELSRLNRTLERIAGLLERQVEGQRLDLAMKRLELDARRLELAEEELRRTEERRRSLENARDRLQARLERFDQDLETMDPEELQVNRGNFERMVTQTEIELKLLDGRLQEATQDLLELQNDLTRRRADLRSMQDRLDRELDGM